MSSVRARGGILVVVAVACALAAASAQAATSTLGQLFVPTALCSGPYTYLQTGVGSGASYTVPAPGVITSWSFQDGGTTVTGLKLKVGRAAGGANYTITAEAAAGVQSPSSVNRDTASIPVQAGDLIGIAQDGGGCGSITGDASDTFVANASDVPPNTTLTFTPAAMIKLPVSVQETLRPQVEERSPQDNPRCRGS